MGKRAGQGRQRCWGRAALCHGGDGGLGVGGTQWGGALEQPLEERESTMQRSGYI